MPTHWISLTARVSERRKAAVADYLLGRGARGLTEHHAALTLDDDGPIVAGEPGEWRPPPPPSPDSTVRITGWFADEGQADSLHAGLGAVLHDLDEGEQPELELVPDRDWNLAWKEKFKPTRIADGVWVVPSWCEPPDEAAGALHLQVDPGMAFGTGTHPTTSLCVGLLRGVAAGASVLDVGTGTGILAIAALKLGADRAVGVDPDKNSVDAARENARLNGVEGRFGVHPGSVEQAPEGRFDVVVANLLAPLLCRLVAPLCERVDAGGALILSGLLDRQRAGVLEGFEARGFQVVDAGSRDGWSALLLRRR